MLAKHVFLAFRKQSFEYLSYSTYLCELASCCQIKRKRDRSSNSLALLACYLRSQFASGGFGSRAVALDGETMLIGKGSVGCLEQVAEGTCSSFQLKILTNCWTWSSLAVGVFSSINVSATVLHILYFSILLLQS